jgi:hypothetical protein
MMSNNDIDKRAKTSYNFNRLLDRSADFPITTTTGGSNNML